MTVRPFWIDIAIDLAALIQYFFLLARQRSFEMHKKGEAEATACPRRREAMMTFLNPPGQGPFSKKGRFGFA
jgi:hypothetical protein